MKTPKKQTKTLGPTSARLIEELVIEGKSIFTLEDACKIYGKPKQETTYFLRDLVNRGVLTRIKSGIFLILQFGQESAQLDNWPLIANVLTGPNEYFISHYSAMRLHGMTTHPLMNVFITMTKRKLVRKVHKLSYQFIYAKEAHFWGKTQLWVTKQEKVYVSDLERTILDGFDRPDLCGGIKEVVRGIWSKQKQIHWKKLAEYAAKYHSRAAVKRLGYILESLNLDKKCTLILNHMISSNHDYILLEPNEEKSGKYLSKWKLQINMNIEEILASVWS